MFGDVSVTNFDYLTGEIINDEINVVTIYPSNQIMLLQIKV